MSSDSEEQYYSYATNSRGPLSELVGKTASGNFCSHQQQSEMLKKENEELKSKIASMENEKQQEDSKAKETLRNTISSMVPRNLPQYRSDEDFDKEVELRVGQIGPYTSLEDLECLYDAKLRKYARQLAGKTASQERRQFYDFIHNPFPNIVGNNVVYGKNSSNPNPVHRYEPITTSSSRYPKGRTASLTDSSFWFLDLFDNIGS